MRRRNGRWWVKIIVRPYSLASSISAESRAAPPGWTTATTPPAIQEVSGHIAIVLVGCCVSGAPAAASSTAAVDVSGASHARIAPAATTRKPATVRRVHRGDVRIIAVSTVGSGAGDAEG